MDYEPIRLYDNKSLAIDGWLMLACATFASVEEVIDSRSPWRSGKGDHHEASTNTR